MKLPPVHEVMQKYPLAREAFSYVIWCAAYGFSSAHGHDTRACIYNAYKASSDFKAAMEEQYPPPKNVEDKEVRQIVSEWDGKAYSLGEDEMMDLVVRVRKCLGIETGGD